MMVSRLEGGQLGRAEDRLPRSISLTKFYTAKRLMNVTHLNCQQRMDQPPSVLEHLLARKTGNSKALLASISRQAKRD